MCRFLIIALTTLLIPHTRVNATSGVITHYREAKEEANIDRPKEILKNYQKNQQYRETKMMGLHKNNGIELLFIGCNQSKGTRHWFRGHHVYDSKTAVIDRFRAGKPLSCFCLEQSEVTEEVHVAFTEEDKRGVTVKYLTFRLQCNTRNRPVQDTGVHFSLFVLQTEEKSHVPKVTSKNINVLRSEIVSHALMLPLVNTNPGSHTQLFYHFTLVYSDWEVLRCTIGGPKKGRAAVEKQVFEKMLELTD